jgi:acid phosphatase type 7
MLVRKSLLVRVFFSLAAALFLALQVLTHSAATSQTLTINPVADAYVNSSSPTTNYGTAVSLRVDGSPVVNSLLRFTVSGTAGQPVTMARLMLYANANSPDGISARPVSNDAWIETGITFGSAPSMGNNLDTSTPLGAGTWVSLDVTSYVTGDGTYSFALTSAGSTASSLVSREGGVNAPKLVLSTGSTTTTAPSKTPIKTSTPQPTSNGSSSVLLLAGDICKYNQGQTDYTGNCKKTGDLVRSLLSANPGAQVQTLGDNVNNDTGTSAYDSQYKNLYAPNWGSFLNVTHAAMGNHDTYAPSGTTPYFAYFGAAAGPKPGGYYSYNLGSAWHVIVLNAECSEAGGCAPGTVQYDWLKNDLASNTRKCVMAVWHQPRWTSGRHTDDSTYAPWWTLLYQYKVDVVANGHNHNYERFNLIDPSEKAASDGIREFIVGTGGAPGDGFTYSSHPLDSNEAVRNQSAVYGVLKMTFSSSSYSWKFMPVSGYSFTDSGTTACH